jgi:hypothetical protein
MRELSSMIMTPEYEAAQWTLSPPPPEIGRGVRLY